MDHNKFRSIIYSAFSLALGATLLSGCGDSAGKEPDQAVFDEAVAGAHFLSAPGNEDESTADNITDFVATCRIISEGETGYIVLGDKTGEYGNLLLVGAGAFADSDAVTVKTCLGGVLSETYSVEMEPQEDAEGKRAFDISVSVSGGKANITVDGKEYDPVDTPFTSLGCVGTYVDRGLAIAYMDDLEVTAGGETIFADDFDGNFVNTLHEYNYSNEQDSVFSPYFIKREDFDGNNALIITTGFLLSETEKDCAPIFKKEFEAKAGKIESAYLCMTSLGSFEATINSQKVTDHFFDPGKMLYDHELYYVTYDVTDLIKEQNELKIALFHGFYDRGVGFIDVGGIWGKELAVKGALIINYKGGKSEVIPTDDSFLVCDDTRYRENDMYRGEMIDDRFDTDEAEWTNAQVDHVDSWMQDIPCVAKENEPITAYKTISPIGVTEPVPGHFVYDFGENLAGTIRLDMSKFEGFGAGEGQVITFRYGEFLNTDSLINSDGPAGTVWTRNLQTAISTDYYVFGDGKDRPDEVTFSHTYHGFRYLEVTGSDTAIPQDAISVLALSSDLEETGEFTCSNETINQYYENSVRSLRSNLMDCPTDCAQRDERLGWAGDAQLVSGFAMYQFDTSRLYQKYVKELQAKQRDDGKSYDIAPSNTVFGGHSCWGDAIVTIPWNLYLQYGDKEILAQNVEPASKWVDYLAENSEDYLFSSDGYGDHLSMQSLPEEVTDTAWCAHSARLVSKMYTALGDDEKATKYAEITDHFTQKWQETYIRDDASVEAGILYPDYETETAYSLGLSFELFPEDMRQAAADRLRILSEYGGYLFYPGYSGMSFYLPSLCEYGHGGTAVQVMTNTAPGGLAHPLSMGLTTNPESVDAFRYNDDGDYYIGGSLNHAAYSSVSQACYEYILGIQTDETAPGFEHFYVRPLMTEGIASASGSYESVRGKISVSWNSDERSITVEVPKGTTCTVVLPGGETNEVTEGQHSFNW
ncbi:hypothetical protein D6855_07135 [Butyrivibrio sp. CB08]|uniref:family 78 glycoside hydrolase catalytic domain n=1 Tax=Butyrivibrio sp. CB08 TaxID=2364879 RepID=UPI000EAA10D5|nr:family 78 glycoside hydrolase catalytic domain [Butyrivibrio sp. CB08]RKM60483.1 hypothetical protein D6855_07135 [Butyrivibrio sp. CB08]